jgi:hypothetical protein
MTFPALVKLNHAQPLVKAAIQDSAKPAAQDGQASAAPGQTPDSFEGPGARAVAPVSASALDPTGAQDSTAALQRLIDASAGKRLVLPHGIYSVTSLILPQAGIDLIASGVTFRLGAGARDGTPMVVLPAGAHDIRIRGLEIDGRSSATPAPHRISGIASQGHVTDVTLEGLNIHDVPLNAIELSNGDASWNVADNRIERTGRHGIVVDFVKEQVQHLRIADNHVDHCALSPITIIAADSESGPPSAAAKDVVIEGNSVSHNGLDINSYSPNTEDVTVIGNRIDDNGILDTSGHALHFGGRHIRILDNAARNTALSAIVISAWPNSNPSPSDDFVVSGNVVDNVLSAHNGKGILIQNASDGLIRGNRITGAREASIDIAGDALGHPGHPIHDVRIEDNRIRGPDVGTRGISVSNASGVWVSDSNRFEREP